MVHYDQTFNLIIRLTGIMSNQNDPVKQNIIDWCKADNIPCEDNSATSPKSLWALKIGNYAVTIHKPSNSLDRIYIQSGISLNPDHRTMVNQTWQPEQKNDMMMKLKMLATQYDVNLNFGMDNNDLISFSTYKIHFHTSISKADFLSLFIKIQTVHEIFLNQLNLALGIATQQLQASQDAGSTNPLSG